MTFDEFVESHGGKVCVSGNEGRYIAYLAELRCCIIGVGITKDDARAALAERVRGTYFTSAMRLPFPEDLTL